jgi:hypothetical protein
MLMHLRPTRGVGHPRTPRSRPARLHAIGRGLRAALLVAAVFSLAMVAGGLAADLIGQLAAEPDPLELVADDMATTPATAGDRLHTRQVFALSLIYSGAVGLAVSLTWIVIIARRRRLW